MRRTLVGVAIIACLATVATTATAQTAEPRAIEESSAESTPKQSTTVPGPLAPDLSDSSPVEDVIPPVAERIFELGTGHGFVSQRTDYDNRSISVLWQGEVPAEIREYIESKPYGVSVTISTGAKYSREEGNAARSRILEDPIAQEIGIVSAAVNLDGSGLELGITLEAVTPEQLDRLAKLSGLKADEITITGGRKGHDGYASRQDDTNPWKGGARTEHAGSLCSSGFAVLAGSAGRLLSARHCDPGANAVVTDAVNQWIAPGGTSVSGAPGVDSLLIDPSASPATTPRVYTGSWASGSTAVVKNWYSNWPGDPVCASGAARGERCGTIYHDNDTHLIYGYNVGVIQVSAPAGSIMAGHGDSGGPVYRGVSGGVQARGIILGPDTDYAETYSCGSVAPWASGSSCSRYLDYVPISTILNTWGVALEVG